LCSLDAELAKKGRLYERNQYFPRSPDRAVHDPAAPQDAQPETKDRRVRNTKDVSLLRIDHISIEGMLLGVRQACYSGGVFDCKEMNTAHLIVGRRRRTEDKSMKNTKFVVKANRGDTHAPEYVQRVDPTPIHMTTNLKRALVMGKFMAEDAVKSLEKSRCRPELVPVQDNAQNSC